MEPDKNLHARIPPALLAQLKRTAQAKHVTVDEVVEEAVERHLHKDAWQDLVEFGRRHSKARGLKPSDVAREIAAVRREAQERPK
jgi:endonuclease III